MKYLPHFGFIAKVLVVILLNEWLGITTFVRNSVSGFLPGKA